MDGLFHEKNQKWMMTGGTPISGNPQMGFWQEGAPPRDDLISNDMLPRNIARTFRILYNPWLHAKEDANL